MLKHSKQHYGISSLSKELQKLCLPDLHATRRNRKRKTIFTKQHAPDVDQLNMAKVIDPLIAQPGVPHVTTAINSIILHVYVAKNKINRPTSTKMGLLMVLLLTYSNTLRLNLQSSLTKSNLSTFKCHHVFQSILSQNRSCKKYSLTEVPV